ncbi:MULTISPECIES: autotransporter outer membrane beta-barrel domain-containing protein [unclassified Yoonia]|uniref:autotransporter outer membrane beta-barrel domain-containing protein n=1 Tax=unclassified Yoonia TaxID=2629118 RepID=UPI002AFF5B27|nr:MULTISPECIES: autotransporter outer membrane beta-barrel domain-containing protein [unclassified Yoonia]
MSYFHTSTAIVAAMTALQVFAAPAYADCVPGGDATNPTLTCTASDTGNINDSRDNLAITVESDAELVRANGRPVQLDGSDQSVLNNGLIESGNDDAIRGQGANLTITNAGTIRGGDRGIRLQDDANGFTLNNLATGRIFAEAQAVRLDEDNPLANAMITNDGLIQSTDGRAIQTRGPGGTVINRGTLRGGEEVIEAREEFTLENRGLIALNGLDWDAATRTWTNNGATSDEDGVQFASGRADNYGVILGTDDGIDIDEGVIHNHETGVIISTGAANDSENGGSGIDLDGTFEPTVGAARASGQMTIINDGYIEGVRAIGVADGHASPVTIRNSGTLRGRSDVAVSLGAGSKAMITNDGLIQSTGGRAIQARAPGTIVTNRGTLRGGEEVVEAREDFTLENYGTIALNGLDWDAATQSWTNTGATSDEDGVQFASGRADNYGIILGTDDGIDFDEGEIHNHKTGVIISTGAANDPTNGGSGIDLDGTFEPTVGSDRASGLATIVNEGYIEGVNAIGVADGHASPVTIRNSGTLRGRSGTAIRLGSGDDTLELDGGRIIGTVDLGGGTNTLRLLSADAGIVSFAQAPQVLDLSAAGGAALFAGTTLVTAEPKVFSTADRLFSDAALSLSQVALAQQNGSGWWVAGAVLSEDDDRAGAITVGRDFGTFGVFVAANRANADSVDAEHEIDMTGTSVGLRAGYDLGPNTSISGAAFAGQSRMEMTSPALASGSGESDGMHYGLTARAAYRISAEAAGGAFGYDLTGQAGVVASSFDSFAVSGLGGASFDSRDTNTSFASVEAGLLVSMAGGTTLRPFIGAHVIRDSNSDVTMSLNNASTSFGVADTDRNLISLGADLGGSNGALRWNARAEARYDEDDNVQGLFSVSMKF